MSLFGQGRLFQSDWGSGPKRLDLHNASVDETAAAHNLCGFLELHSGTVCVLPFHHTGSCRFVPRDELRAMLRPPPAVGI
jgi:hypothetical protein